MKIPKEWMPRGKRQMRKSAWRALNLVSRTTEFSLFRSVVNALLAPRSDKGIVVKPLAMPETKCGIRASEVLRDASGNTVYHKIGADGNRTYI